MLDAERVQDIARLLADDLAVIKLDAGAQLDFDAATGTLFEADVKVGAHIATCASGFTAFRTGCCYRRESQRKPPGLKPLIC